MVWLPEWLHFQIDRTPVPALLLEKHQGKPSDALLRELAAIDLAELEQLSLDARQIASAITRGSVEIAGLSNGPQPIVGFPQDLQTGPPSYQLFVASLSLERLLLQAYERSGNAEWFQLALRRVLDFAGHEAARRHDVAFLWNDHAIAARAAVLIELWRLVRQQPELLQQHGQNLLSAAQRQGRWLADPGHFTVRTNHGVMQNIGLLQLAAAFPDLPESQHWRQLAQERLELQLAFYVSSEGVVLEHSAGYHAMGTQLLTHALRLIELNGLSASSRMHAAVQGSQAVMQQLRRPDGTLPATGNTSAGVQFALPHGIAATDSPADALYAVAGWALWWSHSGAGQTDTQFGLHWGYHPGHGHKHADEGGVHLWRQGIDWITSTGYWPYGAKLLEDAYGWRGSNATHEKGESFHSRRVTQLIASGRNGHSRFVHVERQRSDGTRLSRQVLQLSPKRWLIIDHIDALPQAELLWTLGPGIDLLPIGKKGEYVAVHGASGQRLRLQLLSGSGEAPPTRQLRGSESPFGGWVVVQRIPRAAHALEVSIEGPTAALLTLVELDPNDIPAEIEWQRPPTADGAHWQLTLGSTRVTRQGQQLRVEGDGPQSALLLQPPPATVAAEVAAIRAGFAQALDRYPAWRNLVFYRVRVSKALVAMALALEFLAWATRRWVNRPSPSHQRLGLIAYWLAWTVLGVYLQFFYFV
ncbi:MAG: heparinase II/III family protein [Inhella sp.]